MGRITRGTRIFAICMTAASSALVWLPAAVASAAPAATSATARSAAPAHTSAGTTKAVAPASAQKAGSAAAAAQAAAQAGAISGTVIGPAGVPLAGICVTATGPGGRQLARTNGSGQYTLTGLKAGVYSVDYTDCASPDSYTAQAYPAGSVNVASGQRTSLEPVVLTATSPAQAISTEQAYAQAHESAAAAAKVKYAVTGTVSNTAGKPLAGICVTGTARISIKLTPKGRTYYFNEPTTAKTNKQGFYEIRTFTLPPKYYHLLSWKILFEVGCGNGGNYAPQWWRGAASAGKATALAAKPYKITGIDATLTEGGSIEGIIRGGSASGPGLKGACVQATGVFGQAGVSILTHTGTGTQSGLYVLRGLGSGNYNVSFSPCNAGNYLYAKYGRVFAHVGTTKRVSGFLLPGALVAGTVTSSQAGHAKLGKICLYLSSTRFGISFAETAKSGRYSIDRLTHGTYYVSLFSCGNSGSYAPQFYRAGASTGTLSAATASAIKLSVGEHYTANVAMLPGGTIEGTVTAQSSGADLRDVCVEAVGESGYIGFIGGGPILPLPFADALTNSAGRYRLANLRPGRYVVDFTDCSSSAYASTWFAPEGGISPQWVFVPGGVTTTVDVALPRAGTITGTVTNHAGHGLADVCVEASQPGAVEPSVVQIIGGVGSSLTFTAKTGKYTIGRLLPGQYSVVFAPSCISGTYAPQVYRDKAPGSAGTPVQVLAGRTTPNINATLNSGKSVSGVVTSDITGKPVQACLIVGAGSLNVVPAVYVVTAKSGRFTLKHVVAGTYQAEVSPCSGTALATIFTEISIPAGHSTAVIRLRLPRSGSIAGTITATGVPGGAAYACAQVSSVSGEFEATAIASRSGHYLLTDLAPGTYQVQIDDSCSGGTALAPSVFSVHVAPGATTRVTTALVAGGSITGSVTSSASSGKVAGICVGAFAGETATEPTAVAITASNGSYQIGTLPPGSYLVEFSSGCGAKGYVTQWYDDATTAATATPVTVKPGVTETGVDASMSS